LKFIGRFCIDKKNLRSFKKFEGRLLKILLIFVHGVN